MSGFLSRCGACSLLLVLSALPWVSRAQTPAPGGPKASPTAVPVSLDTPSADTRFVPAKVIKQLPVPYPLTAHLNRVEGVVRVQFSIDEAGNVVHAIVSRTSGSLMLDAVVKDYNLLHWTFQPATLDGKPVPSTKDVEFEFRLDPAEERAIALKRLALPIGTPDAPYPPEAVPYKLRGTATVGVRWTKGGLVDMIYLTQSAGSNVLDHAALRWAYENWHIDPATINDKNKDNEFKKSMKFEPPP